MSTHFAPFRHALLRGAVDWPKSVLFYSLLWSLPDGADAKCRDGCDVLPYDDVREVSGMRLIDGVGRRRVTGNLIENVRETGGLNLLMDPVAWSRTDLEPLAIQMRAGVESMIAGALLWRLRKGRGMPLIVSGDGGFPVDLAHL